MLQSSAALRFLSSTSVAKTCTRAFAQSAKNSRSFLSNLMGAEAGARGAEAKVAAAPANQLESFFAAKPHPTGNTEDFKTLFVNRASKSVAEKLSATYPNTFETVLPKKL